jgi:hypothetical protein
MAYGVEFVDENAAAGPCAYANASGQRNLYIYI